MSQRIFQGSPPHLKWEDGPCCSHRSWCSRWSRCCRMRHIGCSSMGMWHCNPGSFQLLAAVSLSVPAAAPWLFFPQHCWSSTSLPSLCQEPFQFWGLSVTSPRVPLRSHPAAGRVLLAAAWAEAGGPMPGTCWAGSASCAVAGRGTWAGSSTPAESTALPQPRGQ